MLGPSDMCVKKLHKLKLKISSLLVTIVYTEYMYYCVYKLYGVHYEMFLFLI